MKPIKMLLLGESGSGKTGALASLLDAGYNVRMIDLDNGADALVNLVTSPKSPYNKDSVKRLSYRTLTEPMRNVGGRLVPAKATVWQKSIEMLTNWKAEEPQPLEAGNVNEWTPNDVLVIDSLGSLGTAAKNFHLQLNGALISVRTQNEWRRDIGAAQQYLESMLQMLYDTSVRCNVLVTSHVTYSKADGTMPSDGELNAQLFGFPAAIGRAIVPRIPRYFNHMLLAEKIPGSEMRQIFTKTHGNINLKSGAPLNVVASYKIETGLADYFKAVRGEGPET